MKRSIYFADLTHTGKGIHSPAFPLGVGYVCSYANEFLGNDFETGLFKFPEELSSAIITRIPTVLGFSNYSWNQELNYELGAWAKQHDPNIIVVFGGPNFPSTSSERAQYLAQRPAIDFFIEGEGEVAFVELVRKLQIYEFNIDRFKKDRELVDNCNYVVEGQLLKGQFQWIKDLSMIPSPYSNDVLHQFFSLPLSPMIQTTRGCPFSCAYCADGVDAKGNVRAFNFERVKDELDYIAANVKNMDELVLTDLNFGMYSKDVQTAQYISEIQDKYNYPLIISASFGKNKPQRVIETVSKLKNPLLLGAAIQSSDETVLANIKRSNISRDAFEELIEFGKSYSKDILTFTEVILALPGDTKEKHFESLRYGIEHGVTSIKMYQAMLLTGTEMASQETRKQHGLMTKFRVIPGAFGVYKFGDQNIPIAEIDEIVVGGEFMTFDDYVSCRVMNLLIETFVNNALFEEILSALRAIDVSVFDFLIYLHEHQELYSPKMNTILDDFIKATKDDLYDSYEAAKTYVLDMDVMKKHLEGELGVNELLVFRSILYLELEDIASVFLKAVKNYLVAIESFNANAEEYLEELTKFIVYRKKDFRNFDETIRASFNYDFVSIAEANFEVNCLNATSSPDGIPVQFFHTEDQKVRIQNSIALYEGTPSGLGRMIQRSNLKKMYRQFQRV